MGLLSEWPWRGRAKGGVLAVALGESSLRYVFARDAGERGATLAAWGLEARGSQTRESFLKRAKALLPRAGAAIVVLDPRDYQILQLEAPNVPPAEVRGAVRWKATEFVEGSPLDYTIDVLDVSAAGEGPGKVIAVAAHNDLLRSRMRDGESLGLALSVIDVAETAERNLLHAALLAESPGLEVAGALFAQAGHASMIISVRGELRFFRRFEFNVDRLALPVEEEEPLMMAQGQAAEAAARSLTQLQRTLDLWDHTYAQLPLDTLRVHAGAQTAAIVDRIAPAAGVDTRPLALSGVFRGPAGRKAPPWEDPAYVPLLGALLRPGGAP